MKRMLLTFLVAITFALYSFHQRHDDSSTVVKPPSAVASTTTAPTTTTQPTTSTTTTPTTTPTYKDGQYTGQAADAYYGYIQVQAVINGGKITDVKFLQYPNDRQNSVAINSQAMPWLTQEALKAQSARVDIISGATDTSQAFIQSLSSALNSARS